MALQRACERVGILAGLVCLAAMPAAATVDPDAEIILVRQDCGALDDCFETIADALAWTWNTRVPTASEPLLWNVGPGTWNETWTCPGGGGHVTVRGAGREQTIIGPDTGSGGPVPVDGGLAVGCEKLEFMDLTFRSPDWAFRWVGAGSSTWTDVDLVSIEGGVTSIAWADDVCLQGQEELALHYFFGSRLVVQDATSTGYPVAAWYGNCSDSWFYGGEMVIEVDEAPGSQILTLVSLTNRADLRVFGSALRAVSSPPGNATVFGVNSGSQSSFHMHGGIISMTATSGNVTQIGMIAGGGTIHTPDTAFNLVPSGTGTVSRLVGNAAATASPFQWQSGTTPPVSTEGSSRFASFDGQDMYVETDCASGGDCDGAGSETHLMIYNEALCGDCMPWFDVVTGACRPDPSPGTGGACDP